MGTDATKASLGDLGGYQEGFVSDSSGQASPDQISRRRLVRTAEDPGVKIGTLLRIRHFRAFGISPRTFLFAGIVC